MTDWQQTLKAGKILKASPFVVLQKTENLFVAMVLFQKRQEKLASQRQALFINAKTNQRNGLEKILSLDIRTILMIMFSFSNDYRKHKTKKYCPNKQVE